MARGIRPTVYLIKSSVTDADHIFKEVDALEVSEGDNIGLYYQRSHPHAPDWASFLAASFDIVEDVFRNSSSYAVIVLRVDERFFAIPFGMGSHLINLAKIEYNFGLRVAINNIPKSDLRQVDLTTPEATSQKTRKQAVKNSTPEEFGINKRKDILRGVIGALPKGHEFGKSLKGKDGIMVRKKIENIQELQQLCSSLLVASQSDHYKTDYPWIDNIAVVADPITTEILFNNLIQKIQNHNFDHMYIAQPEFVEHLHEYEGFVFTGGDRKRKQNKTAFPFPTMSEVVEELGEECIAELTEDRLSDACKVYLKTADDEFRFGWPLSRCIVWETEHEREKYILSEGDWYKVDSRFYQEVSEYFDSRLCDLGLPEYKSEHSRESEYNAEACRILRNAYLFDLGHGDAKGRSITQDNNEICDIFDAENKRFVHIKVGKSSPDISHLLRQGVFSGQALKGDAEALETFRRNLTELGCPKESIPSAETLQSYRIAFGILLGKTQKKDIPFFSKLSFRDAAHYTLGMMGYECDFGYIIKEEPKKDAAAACEAIAEVAPELVN